MKTKPMANHEQHLAAVLVKTNSDETGTIEVTHFDGKWSFRQFGKLSKNYDSLAEAVQAIKDAEISYYDY